MGELSEDQFIEWVKQAEQEAESEPARYKTKLILFSLLGYVVIFTILFLLLGMVGRLIGIAFWSSTLLLLLVKKKIIFLLLFAIWTFTRELRVTFESPQGYTLARSEFPKLFGEIDALKN